MKKQNGFISSSSSVSICYTHRSTTTFDGYTGEFDVSSNYSVQSFGVPYSEYSKLSSTNQSTAGYSWKTYASKSYMRIEYFLEAVEKIGEAYSKNNKTNLSLINYSKNVAAYNKPIYNGFIDVVITFPTYIRLAGIELINPWINKLNSSNAGDWRYLPSNFRIYKVKTENINKALDEVSYHNDVANITDYKGSTQINPVRYDQVENDKNLIFLGNYEVNWENKSSYKCFFKFNPNDSASTNILNENNIGTATWECKQLVLRIFDTKANSYTKFKDTNVPGKSYTYIEEKIRQYILEKELEYGSKYCGNDPDIDTIGDLIGKSEINYNKKDIPNWTFGGNATRSYISVNDVYFSAGIDYKLGGIQLLLSPDIFSISEMKMYDYASRKNNRVFIGQWDPSKKQLDYYGARTIKTSPFININKNTGLITWHHNFNIPPKYLDAKMYIRFKIDYDSFSIGDVVSNIVNTEGNPLSMKMTGSTIEVNLSNGVGFTNPTTGEFMTFKNGVGIQMNKPGNNDAVFIAKSLGATIEDGGSSIAAKIEGDCPFQVYFVIKRLF